MSSLTESQQRFVQDAAAQALEASASRRGDLLAELCSGREELRAEVESLLEHVQKADSQGFLEHAPSLDDLDGAIDEDEPRIGERLASYRIEEEIGRGGFGIVYRARQEEPIQRHVAIKVLRRSVESREIVARFRQERQTLALLDHPSIAHVYDAGVGLRGHSYVVMELVEGASITEYCDCHLLAIRDRIRLMRDVCRAVHHAHQRGIIHRDLKPSNVLVSGEPAAPVCKIIDFGIAKALDAAPSDMTQVGVALGTPAYMSPEQLAGGQGKGADVRTDVYALGVVLYELLAGVCPFESDSPLRPDAPTPSRRLRDSGANVGAIAARRGVQVGALRRELAAGPSWILAKALRPDPQDRYPSADAMAADLDAWLDCRPLEAAPRSALYVLRTLARRRRFEFAAGVAAATILVLALIGAIVGLALVNEARRSEAAARDLAEREQYAAQMLAASSAWQLGDVGTARSLLAATREDLRGWEYRFLLGELDRSVATIEVGEAIRRLVRSRDGTILVTGMDDGVDLWDARSGRLRGFIDDRDCFALALGGERLAVSSRHGELAMYDIAGRRELWRKSGYSRAPAVSPDGARVASARGRSLVVLDCDTGEQLAALDLVASTRVIPDPQASAFDRSGDRLALGTSAGAIVVWRPGASGTALVTTAHGDQVSDLVWLDEDRIASVGRDGDLVISDAVNGARLASNSWPSQAMAVTQATDGRLLAVGMSSGQIHLVDAETAEAVATLSGHIGAVHALQTMPDGRIVSAGSDGAIRSWTFAPELNPASVAGPSGCELSSGDIRPSGDLFAAAARDGKIWLLPLPVGASGAETIDCAHGGCAVWDAAFIGNHLLASIGDDGNIRFWDVKSGGTVASSEIALGPAAGVVLPRGDPARSLDKPSDTALGPIYSLRQRTPQGAAARVALSGDERSMSLVAASSAGLVQLYDCSSLPPRLLWARAVPEAAGVKPPEWTDALHSVDRAPHGVLVAGAAGLVLLDNEGRLVALQPMADPAPHLRSSRRAEFSPDGRLIAFGDGLQRLIYDGHTLELIREFEGPGWPTFSPDGTRLVVGGPRESATIIDTATWKEVLRLPPVGTPSALLRFSPDGRHICGTLPFWLAERFLVYRAP